MSTQADMNKPAEQLTRGGCAGEAERPRDRVPGVDAPGAGAEEKRMQGLLPEPGGDDPLLY